MLNFLPLPNICGHSGVSSSNCIQDAQFASQQYQRNYYWSFKRNPPAPQRYRSRGLQSHFEADRLGALH